MELHERVKQVSGLAGSETKLASRLKIPQTTFNGYLKAARQDNLWPVLPKILELFPHVRREWLYFGEGEMTSGGLQSAALPPRAAPDSEQKETSGEADALRAEVSALKDKLIVALEENARLHKRIEQLLKGGDADGGSRKAGQKAAAHEPPHSDK